ncbi:MAG: hypothetical protein BMS9Abin12_1289 [Acidimicrobiia bacterium]|nr:MAG: hypothetical protein BMS9Abin12_1289 [Acidimicrobiia bacterium]
MSQMNMIAVPDMQMIRVDTRRSTDVSADRLASVGVGAVLRIEALGSLEERDELTARRAEILEVPIEILEVPIEEFNDVVTGAFPNAS